MEGGMRYRRDLLRVRAKRRVRSLLLLALLLVLASLIATAPGRSTPKKSEDAKPLVGRTASNASFEAAARRVLFGTRALGDEIDVQLFVVWHSAWRKRRVILEDIQKNFVVLAVAEYDWGAALLDGLWVLYGGKGGWARAGMKRKVEQCGRDAFVAIVVADTNPYYARLRTAHGFDFVNTRMHAKKTQYRRWCGGSGFSVHGTFNVHEANHNVRVLFHVTPADILSAPRLQDLVPQYLRDPAPFRTQRAVLSPGPNGWTCAALRFAFGAFARVAVTDAATGAVVWGCLTEATTTTAVGTYTELCEAWPSAMVMHGSRADCWGLVALLRAEPEDTYGKVRADSAFTIRVEGRRHNLRIAKHE